MPTLTINIPDNLSFTDNEISGLNEFFCELIDRLSDLVVIEDTDNITEDERKSISLVSYILGQATFTALRPLIDEDTLNDILVESGVDLDTYDKYIKDGSTLI